MLLLSLYKEYDELYSQGKISHSKMWSNIEERLNNKGYSYTIEQCHNKMENFKRGYKGFIEKRGKSGRASKEIPYQDVSNLLSKTNKIIYNIGSIIILVQL